MFSLYAYNYNYNVFIMNKTTSRGYIFAVTYRIAYVLLFLKLRNIFERCSQEFDSIM